MTTGINKVCKKIISVICLSICLSFLFQGGTAKVHAESMFVEPDSFSKIDGDGKYLGKDYTYHLDMEKTGVIDAFPRMMNSLENTFFNCQVILAKVAVYGFYICMSFDASNILSGQLHALQDILHTAIFEPLFYIVLAITSIKLINRLLKRNFIGILQDCAYVIGIMLLSYFVVYQSDAIVSSATSISKSVGLEAMVGLNDSLTGGSTSDSSGSAFIDDYAAKAAGELWKNMIHNPWLQWEFDGKEPDSSLVDDLMALKDIKTRTTKVSDSGLDCFLKDKAGQDLGVIWIYSIPLAIKCGIYFVLAAIQIFFQIVAVFFVLLAPVILILSMIPGYDFMIIEIWAKKILEFEIGIIISTMMIAFLTYLDNYMFSLNHGWFMSIVLQVITALSLYLGRKHIFGLFQNLQRTVQNPYVAKNMLRRAGTVDGRKVKQSVDVLKNARTRMGAQESEDRGKEYRKYDLQRAMKAKNAANKNEMEQKETAIKRPSMEKVIEFKRKRVEQEASEERSTTNTAQSKVTSKNTGNTGISKNTVSKNARMNNEKEGAANTVRNESLQANMENTQVNLRKSAAKRVRQNDESDVKERATHTSDAKIFTGWKHNVKGIEKDTNTSSVNTEYLKDAGSEGGISAGKEGRRNDVLIRKERPASNVNEKSFDRQNLKASKSEKRVRTAAFTTPTIKIRPEESKPIVRTDLSKTLEERKENLNNIRTDSSGKVRVSKKVPVVKETADTSVKTSVNKAMTHAPRTKIRVDEAKEEVRPNLSKNLGEKEKKIL